MKQCKTTFIATQPHLYSQGNIFTYYLPSNEYNILLRSEQQQQQQGDSTTAVTELRGYIDYVLGGWNDRLLQNDISANDELSKFIISPSTIIKDAAIQNTLDMRVVITPSTTTTSSEQQYQELSQQPLSTTDVIIKLSSTTQMNDVMLVLDLTKITFAMCYGCILTFPTILDLSNTTIGTSRIKTAFSLTGLTTKLYTYDNCISSNSRDILCSDLLPLPDRMPCYKDTDCQSSYCEIDFGFTHTTSSSRGTTSKTKNDFNNAININNFIDIIDDNIYNRGNVNKNMINSPYSFQVGLTATPGICQPKTIVIDNDNINDLSLLLSTASTTTNIKSNLFYPGDNLVLSDHPAQIALVHAYNKYLQRLKDEADAANNTPDSGSGGGRPFSTDDDNNNNDSSTYIAPFTKLLNRNKNVLNFYKQTFIQSAITDNNPRKSLYSSSNTNRNIHAHKTTTSYLSTIVNHIVLNDLIEYTPEMIHNPVLLQEYYNYQQQQQQQNQNKNNLKYSRNITTSKNTIKTSSSASLQTPFIMMYMLVAVIMIFYIYC